MSTKISIIVPVYNVEKYLHECIESILSQTFVEYEVLLVDDGSTDSSGVICDEYAQKDVRIKAYHKSNGGLSAARNTGIELARGEYVIFLDSDDYWIGSKSLDHLYKQAKSNDADVVRGEYISVNERGERIKTIIRNKVGINQTVLDSASFYKRAIAGENFSVLFLYKKSAIDTLRFNEQLKIQEDIDFNIRFLAFPRRCVYTNTVFYVYRKRANSITTLPQVNKLVDAFRICDIFDEYSQISSDAQIISEYQKQSVLKYLRTLSSMVEDPYYNNLKVVSKEIGINSIYLKAVKRLIKYKVFNKKSILILLPPLIYVRMLRLKIFIYSKLCKK